MHDIFAIAFARYWHDYDLSLTMGQCLFLLVGGRLLCTGVPAGCGTWEKKTLPTPELSRALQATTIIRSTPFCNHL